MRHAVLILLCFIFIGCKEREIDTTPSNQELIEYVQDLMYLFPGYKIDFPVYFNPLDYMSENTLAIARHTNSYCIHIRVKRSKWDTSSELRRRALILHELGHCLLKLPHTDKNDQLMSEGITGSIICIFDYGEEECLRMAKQIKGNKDEH